MRQPSAEWIAQMVRHCAHGQRDPRTGLGCQRERADDLGFGWLYFALGRVAEAERVLVLGTGRGFSAACLALAIEHRPGAQVTILDAGFREWPVEQGGLDRADGLWQDQAGLQEHFAPLGLRNLRLMRTTSDEGFARLRESGERFDLIVVDGDHGWTQCLKDLRQALACLREQGIILAHDASCEEWPGVALAIDVLRQEDASLQALVLPHYPGLAVLQKTRPAIRIRPIRRDENEQVNEWRRQAGVTPRPLPDGDDPRPEEPAADPRVGLFAIECDGRLAGGFGVRWREFRREGADEFTPTDGQQHAGYLVYGSVVHPALCGLGVYQWVARELLSWFAPNGFYAITAYPRELDSSLSTRVVGRAGHYTAYHVLPRLPDSPPAYALARQIEYRLRKMKTAQRQEVEIAELKTACADLQAALKCLQQSRSWRWTGPLRRLGRSLRWCRRSM